MEESSRSIPCEPEMVAVRLAALRLALGLSRAELADQIGIDRSSYSKIEKGNKPLLPQNAFKLYELYGVDMNYIYLGQILSLPSSLSKAVQAHLNTETV